MPKRRRVFGWLTVFNDPFTGFIRPVCDVRVLARIIFKDDYCSR